MCPFPVDEKGNQYVIVIVDRFSRFVMLYASIDATALSAAKAPFLVTGLFGAPMQILSDNGPQYVHELIKELLYLMGSDHELTTAYSHQENALVERANKKICDVFAQLSFIKRFSRVGHSLYHSFRVL